MSSLDDEIEAARRAQAQARLNKEQVTNERDEYNKTELDKKANLTQLDTKTFNIKRETRDIEREKEGLTEQLEQFEENVKDSNAPWRAAQPPTSVSTTPARTTTSVSTKFRVSTPESSTKNAIASSSKVKQDGNEERASIPVNRPSQNTTEQKATVSSSKSIEVALETHKSTKREIIAVESSPIRATEKRKIMRIDSDSSSDGEYVVVHQPVKKRTKKDPTVKRYAVASSSSSSLVPAPAPQADKKSGIKLPSRQLMGRILPIFTPTATSLKEFVFPRETFHKHYGGKRQTWAVDIKAENSHNGRVIHCVFPKPLLNPLSVSGIGQPGLVFASRDELFKHELWYVMRQVNVKGPVRWEYCGGYHVARDGILTGKDFDNLSKTVHTQWGNQIIKCKKKNSPIAYADMYDRIQGRMNTQNQLRASDVIAAISNGDESINIIRMECVEYDEAFVLGMMQNPPADAVAGRSPAKKAVKKKTRRSVSPELGESSTLARRSGRLGNRSLVYNYDEVEIASGSDFEENISAGENSQ